MQYTIYSLLQKHGEVMSAKIKKTILGHQQNGSCQVFHDLVARRL